MAGFSLRNVCPMRDFCLYSEMPELLAIALCQNWTQNVVILESELSTEERAWCIRQAQKDYLSKVELLNLVRISQEISKPIIPEKQRKCRICRAFSLLSVIFCGYRNKLHWLGRLFCIYRSGYTPNHWRFSPGHNPYHKPRCRHHSRHTFPASPDSETRRWD